MPSIPVIVHHRVYSPRWSELRHYLSDPFLRSFTPDTLTDSFRKGSGNTLFIYNLKDELLHDKKMRRTVGVDHTCLAKTYFTVL